MKSTQLKRKIIKKLTPEDAVEMAKREFSSAAQRNDESANNFGRRLKKLAKDAEIDKEKKVVNHFLKHLINSTSRQLVTYSTKSMDKAMGKAKRCEERLETLEEIQRESINSVNDKKITPLIKHRCRQYHHRQHMYLKVLSRQTIVRTPGIHINLDSNSIPRLRYSNG